MALLSPADELTIETLINDAFGDRGESITINNGANFPSDELDEVTTLTWSDTYTITGIIFPFYDYKTTSLDDSIRHLDKAILENAEYMCLMRNSELIVETLDSKSMVEMRGTNYAVLGKVEERHLSRIYLKKYEL